MTTNKSTRRRYDSSSSGDNKSIETQAKKHSQPLPPSSTTKKSSTFIEPSWKDILEVPIKIHTKQQFDSLPRAKRIAIVARSSVLHLTLLSCLGPLILRGAIGAERSSGLAASSSSMALTPGLSILWTINVLSWHAFHNLVNDYQDLEDDDKDVNSFRTDYGCHALKQQFLSKSQFIRLMGMVALPGIVLTIAFLRNTVVGPAAPWGLSSLFLYTILFKPFALGEVVIYLVWGPLMAGYGFLAAGGDGGWSGIKSLFTNPAVAQFGVAAFAMIMGKHTDKINRSNKKTLPKLLGYPLALFACGATVLAPHVLLLLTFLKERVFISSSATMTTPTVPLGASLAFLTLFRELPSCLKILSKGQIQQKNGGEPTLPWGTTLKGTVADFQVNRTWPLWFVAACGWHAITFLYLFVIGSGFEWIGRRALFSRLAF